MNKLLGTLTAATFATAGAFAADAKKEEEAAAPVAAAAASKADAKAADQKALAAATAGTDLALEKRSP